MAMQVDPRDDVMLFLGRMTPLAVTSGHRTRCHLKVSFRVCVCLVTITLLLLLLLLH